MSGFLVGAAMWGQQAFQNLAPTGDGSLVYFSSPLRMKGTDQYSSQPKIFIWDEKNGVRLYEQRPPTISGTFPYLGSTTAYNLVAPSISSDGRTIAITGLTDCTFGTPCAVELDRYQAEIRVAGGAPLVMNGVPSVSPNGRFVALGAAVLFPFVPPELTVLDLSTGQQQHLINAAGFPRRHGVANDGTAIIDDPSLASPVELQRWSGATLPLNISSSAVLLIDASGARVFYQTPDTASPNTVIDLMVLDVTTVTSTRLTAVETTSTEPVPFDISDDGSLVAFIQGGQAWIVHSDGTGLMQVTNLQDKVVEVALSGSGSHLFAINAESRMLRINLSSIATEEIIPATPFATGLYFNSGILSPGGLGDAISAKPIPEIQSISLFDHDLPILNAGPSAIELELPYNIPEGIGWPDAVLKQQSDGPFESAMLWASPAQVSNFAPAWYFVDNHVAALHQDFSGPITPANPAHPGEIVHAYGSGFGPVAPQPALGQPASANTLSRTTTPFVCGLEGDDSKLIPANILFAGLAPGWIGLYQFDILLPARPAGVDTYLIYGKAANPFNGNYSSGLLPMVEK